MQIVAGEQLLIGERLQAVLALDNTVLRDVGHLNVELDVVHQRDVRVERDMAFRALSRDTLKYIIN